MPIRLGLAGVGHLGKIHLKCIQAVSDFDLVGFYESDRQKAQEISNETGVKSFETLEALLAEVEALDIVTPTSTHFAVAQKALLQGKHIFIEKPITATLEEAQRLKSLQGETGVVVQVGHVERFNPAMLAIKDMDLNPRFMEVHRLANFNPRGTDVSVVLDLMIHDLDIILSLVPSKVKRVLANGVCLVSNTPDIGNARIEWENGCVANVTASRMSFKNMRKMRLFQPDAYIGVDFLERQAQIIRLSDATVAKSPLKESINVFDLETANGSKQIEIEVPEVKPVNAIEMELSCFANSILSGEPPQVGTQEAYNALSLAFQISQEIDHSLKQMT